MPDALAIGVEKLTPTLASEGNKIPLPPVKGLTPNAGKFVRNVLNSLEDSKAENIVSIDLRGKTSIADMMIVATGRASTHVGAIAEQIAKVCKDMGLPAPRIEGMPHCDWVLVDAGDIIIHVFRAEVRQFYNLEKMWGGDRPDELRAG